MDRDLNGLLSAEVEGQRPAVYQTRCVEGPVLGQRGLNPLTESDAAILKG
jgi:hypothetical protein